MVNFNILSPVTTKRNNQVIANNTNKICPGYIGKSGQIADKTALDGPRTIAKHNAQIGSTTEATISIDINIIKLPKYIGIIPSIIANKHPTTSIIIKLGCIDESEDFTSVFNLISTKKYYVC